MKGAGELTTIHQTLTSEASAILTRSVAEASRRSHSQTTPLHVAATLLSSPSSLLRQACLLSHPTTTNPLHSRALDLCFSVALDRLPSTTTTTTTAHPPPSNALSAALKRAQAHQRRGSPDHHHQQPPLLAVRIELDQLVVSILDDPGVSRVMREASFSSPAVKAHIEHSATTTNSNHYVNSDVNRVLDILSRPKKRNPVLVGDSSPGAVMHDVLRRITAADAPAHLRASRVVPLGDKSQIRDVETRILDAARGCGGGGGGGGGVVLDMGDLKWLVEAPVPANMGVCQIEQESGRAAVAEISEILARLQEAIGGGRLWVVGTATCATYLRCQVYYPTMEDGWDLQAVPIAPPPRSSQFSGGGMAIPMQGGAEILINSVESLASSRCFPLVHPQAQSSLCAACTQSYKLEVANLRPEPHKDLPQWLQIATHNGAEPKTDQLENKEQELLIMKKWIDNCSRLHPNPSSALLNSINGSSLGLQTIQPRSPIAQSISTHRSLSASLQAQRLVSPVKTDLVLGPSKKSSDRNAGFVNSDSVKKLFHGLTEKVSWQLEAAAAVAAAMMQCKSGISKCRRGVGPNSNSWLLFIGPDRVGKRMMASSLSELLFGTRQATTICLSGTPRIIDGDDGESDVKLRGKTPLDRVAEAVRQNPLSVIVLEDVDQADTLVLKAIKLAIEKGRLTDSHKREVSLGSVIFVLTADWLPEDLRDSQSSLLRREEKILNATQIGRPLKLSIEEKSGKRRAEWLLPEEMRNKESCKLGLSLDLNLAVGWDEDTGEGTSDLTVEHEQEHRYGHLAINQPAAMPSVSLELIDSVDETIVFKPVDFNPLRRRICDYINSKFTATMGGNQSIRVDDDVLDQLTGGVWLGGPAAEFENWIDRVLLPAIQRLKSNAKVGNRAIVRLSAVNGSGGRAAEGWMPSTVTVAGTQ